MTLTAIDLQRYLQSRIPLAAAMEVTVEEANGGVVRLCAPLPPNVNHHGTVFGGSISAIALLSAWTLVKLGLQEESIAAEVVIQRNSVEYLRPIEGDVRAVCHRPRAAEWDRFTTTVRKRGRARLVVRAELLSAGELVATFQGFFVATRAETDRDDLPG